MTEQYKRNPNTKCSVCSEPIYRRPSERNNGKVFCSSSCCGISNRKESPCIICGNLILASLHKKTCSRACANKNRAGMKYKLSLPRKNNVKNQRALKIRLIAIKGKKCERCGYNKLEVLQVHHKDRNRENNDLNNLELVCPNCHFEEHYSKSLIK